jgi:iron complex transport system ATP-binding protein
MTDPLLAAEGVSHTFGAQPVLDGVDTSIATSTLQVVVGPNGAGKTTLVRILSGVLRAQAGSVHLRGRPIRSLRRREIARELAVVPQELSVPFPYTVRELVSMGRAPRLGPLGREGREDRDAVDRALARLGLAELSGRRVPTLSAGEKERVALARALAQEADVLVLDEPTAHMDLGHRVHTFEWLRRWVREAPERRGALVVTHDLVLAARFADELVLLHQGRVVAAGAPSAVLTPERIADVYNVEAHITHDADGRPTVVAVRSRIGYGSDLDEPER